MRPWRGETPNLCKVMDKYHKAQIVSAEKGKYLIWAETVSYKQGTACADNFSCPI